MIEPETGIARPAVALVVPEREHRLRRMKRSNCVCPALRDERLECVAALRLDPRILVPGFGRINIKRCRCDVIVAGQHDRDVLLDELGCMRPQPSEPIELVVEFWS